MPIYEFKCQDCGKEFEIFLKNKEEITQVVCPECKSKNIKRLMSVINAVISDSVRSSDKPKLLESHKCNSGTCAVGELPGFDK